VLDGEDYFTKRRLFQPYANSGENFLSDGGGAHNAFKNSPARANQDAIAQNFVFKNLSSFSRLL